MGVLELSIWSFLHFALGANVVEPILNDMSDARSRKGQRNTGTEGYIVGHLAARCSKRCMIDVETDNVNADYMPLRVY